MTNYIFHKTIQNERWDNIAYKYYKNSYNIKPLLEANPHASGAEILPEGEVIKIPIDKDITENDKSKLPIWKQ